MSQGVVCMLLKISMFLQTSLDMNSAVEIIDSYLRSDVLFGSLKKLQTALGVNIPI